MKRSNSNFTLGQFLKMTREKKGFSLRGVEKETGISNAYLSQLEGDKIKQPSPTLLHKLCELYDVPYSTVMDLAGYPTTQAEEEPPHGRKLAARLGRVTKEEEDALVEYLEFLRSRRKKGGR
jgi:transcriptional regulator with XRE-family HTH domain